MRPELFSIPIPGGYVALTLAAALVAMLMAAWFFKLYRHGKQSGDLAFVFVMLILSVFMIKEARRQYSENAIRSARWARRLQQIEDRYESSPKNTPAQELRALQDYYNNQNTVIDPKKRWFAPYLVSRRRYRDAVQIPKRPATQSEILDALRTYHREVTANRPTPSGWLPAAITFHAYSTWLMIGFLVATILGYRRGERIGLKKNDILDFAILAVLGGVFGARIAAVSEQPDKFFYHEYYVEQKELRAQCDATALEVNAVLTRRAFPSGKHTPVATALSLMQTLKDINDVDLALHELEFAHESKVDVAILSFDKPVGRLRRRYIVIKRKLADIQGPTRPKILDERHSELSPDDLNAIRKRLVSRREATMNTLATYPELVNLIDVFNRLEGVRRALRLNEQFGKGDLAALQEQEDQLNAELTSRIMDLKRAAESTSALSEKTLAVLLGDGNRPGYLQIIGKHLHYLSALEKLPARKSEFLNPWAPLQIWSGGLTFYGGAILATIFLLIFCKRRNLSFFEYTDLIAPMLIIGLGFGRIGCFLNGCCSGAVVSSHWYKITGGRGGVQYPAGALPNELFDWTRHNLTTWAGKNYQNIKHLPVHAPLHPSQLYSTFVYWVFLGPLLWFQHPRRSFVGQTTGICLILYAPTRFMLEAVRNEPEFMLGMSVAQLTSLLIFPLGIAFYYISKKRNITPPRSVPKNALPAKQDDGVATPNDDAGSRSGTDDPATGGAVSETEITLETKTTDPHVATPDSDTEPDTSHG